VQGKAADGPVTQDHLSENIGTTVMATRSAYSGFQITLHWLIAILIAAAWFLGDGMGRVLGRVDIHCRPPVSVQNCSVPGKRAQE